MKARGITLLETVISVQILLIVSLFCMATFGQGQRHDLRARQFSTCSFLANQKMQELSSQPVDQLRLTLQNPVSGKYPATFSDYDFQATLSDYEPGIGLLEVVAHSDLGCSSRCSLLLSLDASARGVAVDPHTSRVYFVGTQASGQGNLKLSRFWDDGSGSITVDSSPPNPDGFPLSAVAGAPGGDFLWGLSPNGTLTGMTEDPTLTWQAPETNPAAPLPILWHSVCCASSASLAVASDCANRCLWIYDSVWNPAPYWSTQPCAPISNPLGSPGAVVVDPGGSLVWVADRDNGCLRKFILGDTPPPAYPAAFLERWPKAGPIQGYWDVRSFRPGGAFLGTPQGIAMDDGASSVFVVDDANLWAFVEADTSNPWTKLCPLPAGTRAAGLATDRFGTVFYVNCSDGRLFKIVGDTWTLQSLIP